MNTPSDPIALRSCGLLTRLIRIRPLLLAALLFLAGCVVSYALPAGVFIPCLILFALLLAALLLKKKRRIAAVFLLLAMLPAGMLRFDIGWHATSPFPDQKGALLSGRICETPLWRADTERTICVLNEIEIDGIPSERKLRLYLRGDKELLQQVQLGQRVSCTAHIWRADEDTNPGQFNFSNYLRLRGLSGYATAEIESASFTPAQLVFADAPEQIRSALSSHIDRLFPRSGDLAKAFLLGDRSQLSDSDRESFADSGVAHLLAISGMHISVLAAAVSMLLGRFLTRRRSFLITLCLLLLYGCLIGFSASLTRAIMMYAAFGSAALFGRYSDPLTRIGAALLIYLIVRPCAILDAGFVLSYGASASIILLYEPLKELLHVEKLLHRRPGTGIKAALARLPRYFLQLLITTLAAQLAVLPAVVHYFGAQPLLSFAVNLAAVPLAMAAYIASIVGALSCLAPVAAVGDFLFSLLRGLVSFCSSLPLATLRIARFPIWLVVIWIAACLLASGISRLNIRIRRFVPLFIVPAILISNACAMLSTMGCSIIFMDAGQADCAVIRTQGKVYLVDTGDSYSPASDYLQAMNYRPEALFISHLHSDHAGGLEGILESCPPKRIYLPEVWQDNDIDEGMPELIGRAAEQGCEIITLSAGDEFALSNSTILRVLHPTAGISAGSANDDSMVLLLEHRETRALFCGDAPAEAIASAVCDCDILKVGHHGAKDSLNADLLVAASPSVAIVSSGYNNYGHPAPESLDLLERAGAAIFRTDSCGAVSCHLEENGSVRVQTYLNPEALNG